MKISAGVLKAVNTKHLPHNNSGRERGKEGKKCSKYLIVIDTQTVQRNIPASTKDHYRGVNNELYDSGCPGDAAGYGGLSRPRLMKTEHRTDLFIYLS